MNNIEFLNNEHIELKLAHVQFFGWSSCKNRDCYLGRRCAMPCAYNVYWFTERERERNDESEIKFRCKRRVMAVAVTGNLKAIQ